jgi:hypothetical protein
MAGCFANRHSSLMLMAGHLNGQTQLRTVTSYHRGAETEKIQEEGRTATHVEHARLFSRLSLSWPVNGSIDCCAGQYIY